MRIYIILLLVIFGACKNKKSTKNSHLTPEYEVEFSTDLVQTNNSYTYLGDVKIQNRSLSETSGICASRQKKGVIWAHNDSISYIFLADIGDNSRKRKTIQIYRFSEPAVDTTLRESEIVIPLNDLFTYTLTFPDGEGYYTMGESSY